MARALILQLPVTVDNMVKQNVASYVTQVQVTTGHTAETQIDHLVQWPRISGRKKMQKLSLAKGWATMERGRIHFSKSGLKSHVPENRKLHCTEGEGGRANPGNVEFGR